MVPMVMAMTMREIIWSGFIFFSIPANVLNYWQMGGFESGNLGFLRIMTELYSMNWGTRDSVNKSAIVQRI